MFLSGGVFKRFVASLTSLIFVLSVNTVSAVSVTDTLAPELYSARSHSGIPVQVIEEKHLLSISLLIADHFFRQGGDKESLAPKLLKAFARYPAILSTQKVDLTGVEYYPDTSGLRIPFVSNVTGDDLELWLYAGTAIGQAEGEGFRIGSYNAFLRRAGHENPRGGDFKGPLALSSRAEEAIQSYLESEKLVEVFLDSATGALKGQMLKFGDGHGPFPETSALYRLREFDISLIFTEEELQKLRAWLGGVAGKIDGEPVRLRLALGTAALSWQGSVESANIAYSDPQDQAIYMGVVLLKHMLRDESGQLMRKVLDEDELMHLKGLSHGDESLIAERLRTLKGPVSRHELFLEKLRERDVWWLRDRIRNALGESRSTDLEELFYTADAYQLSIPEAPVESSYPVKKAVALLGPEEQHELVEFFFQESSLRNLTLISDLLLMLVPTLDPEELSAEDRISKEVVERIRQSWISEYAPELEGRSLWQISPEIWHEAGGLARVMQYHSAAMADIIADQDVTLRQVEPHYQWRINSRNEEERFDYRSDVTYPFEDLAPIDPALGEFEVEVGSRRVMVQVQKGTNELGVEVYFIRDVQPDGSSFYTHSLYNYRQDVFEPDPRLPTWDEFAIFFSKASLELVRRIENHEKRLAEEQGAHWKAPLLHLNDSQVALVPVYRRMQLDEALKRKENDAHHEIDPVLENSILFFTTHTYGNRRDQQPLEVLEFMGITDEYMDLFEHKKFSKGEHGEVIEIDCWDMASAGLRASHGQNGVSWAHVRDVGVWDSWVNDPDNPRSAQIRENLRYADIHLRIRAISNGDHREGTAKYFREYLKEIDSEANFEHPSPVQVAEAKKMAKRALKLPGSNFVWSEEEVGDEELVAPIDENMPVISYSGRLVWEKAGRGFPEGMGDDERGALTDSNIIELVRRGAQVVFYGNVQANEDSETMAQSLRALAERIRDLKRGDPEAYPGRFVFVPRFSLDEQRMLLAASDIGVHDSYPATEGAGFTEADDAVSGGIVVAPKREKEFYNHGLGEGLFQAQGELMDLAHPGRGNTLVPERLDSHSYLDSMLTAVDLFHSDPEENTLALYQATSVRFSRILEARLTSAAYLREFHKATAEREVRRLERERMREQDQHERAKRSLMGDISQQVVSAKQLHELSRLLSEGDLDKAIERFYTGGFTGYPDQMRASVASFMNLLLSLHYKGSIGSDVLYSFLGELREGIPVVLGTRGLDIEKLRDLQIMVAQTEIIASWMDRSVPHSSEMRLTAAPGGMIENEDRGEGFIEAESLHTDITEVKSEGESGFYWRGVESVSSKLSSEQVENARTDGPFLPEDLSEASLLYIMDHGFLKVPDAVRGLDGRLSTIHETMFLSSLIPGSIQATSTGAGHYQARQLDIKHVTRGEGVQLNVRYHENGDIAEVIVHHVKEGDWAVALPGHVDLMINLGGLAFNEISYELTEEQALGFLSGNVSVPEAPEKANMKAPLAGMRDDQGAYLVATLEDMPEVKWISGLESPRPGSDLLQLYAGLDEKELDRLAVHFRERVLSSLSGSEAGTLAVKVQSDIKIPEAVPERKLFERGTEAVTGYLEENELFIQRTLGADKGNKLFRIPEEFIDIAGPEDIRRLLAAVQSHENAYVEIFSMKRPEGIASSKYDRFVTKDLPEVLRSAESRTRANTVTLFPVCKGEELPTTALNSRWNGQSYERSIIVPVGVNYDIPGIARSMVLGLRLSEINRLEAGPESALAVSTLRDYLALAEILGQDNERSQLRTDDLVAIASGKGAVVVEAINKLISLLPVVPFDVEQVRQIHEKARAVFTSA